jgi:hypothetical protein
MVGTLRLRPDGAELRAELKIGRIEIEDLAALLRTGRKTYTIERVTLRLRGTDGAAAEVAPTGSLTFLDEDTSHLDPGRVIPDAIAVAVERLRGRSRDAQSPGRLLESGAPCALFALLVNMVQRRQLVYCFEVVPVEGIGHPDLPPGTRLRGIKAIIFGERANPWRQLMEMRVWRLKTENETADLDLGMLKTDLGHFAKYREPLLSVRGQRDHASALADIAGLGLLVVRALILTHLPHFIPPGDSKPRSGERWPAAVDGQFPRVHGLEAGARLSHYSQPCPEGQPPTELPVLLIHGLSAAGSTFAHGSIPVNLVSYLRRRGRDVWVLDLRTSSANEHSGQPRPGPFTFEETARLDIPPAIDRILAVTGSSKVDVVAHCIGSAMFCLAVLQHPTLHRSIGHAVLSQVGLRPQMAPFNRARGYLASMVEPYLEIDEFDVRAETGSGFGLGLLDAFLATFPYSDDDFEAARAAALLQREEGVRGDFRLVRHRADALIGQMVQLENLADDTLLALDAIVGWVKTRTLAQTIHLSRQGVLTDADGDNDAVSSERISQRFGFPVLHLHGRRNEVFEWEGSLESHALLKRVFGEPLGENCAVDGDVHLGVDTPRQFVALAGYGHQDPFIGKNVQFDVFPYIDGFLRQSFAPVAAPAATRSFFACEAAWIGPMLGWVRDVAWTDPAGRPVPAAELALLLHPGGRRAETLCGVLVARHRDLDRQRPPDRLLLRAGAGIPVAARVGRRTASAAARTAAATGGADPAAAAPHPRRLRGAAAAPRTAGPGHGRRRLHGQLGVRPATLGAVPAGARRHPGRAPLRVGRRVQARAPVLPPRPRGLRCA